MRAAPWISAQIAGIQGAEESGAFNTQHLQDIPQRAEAGEGGLKKVEANEDSEPVPVGVMEYGALLPAKGQAQ